MIFRYFIYPANDGYPIYGNLWRMKPEEIGEHRGVSTCQMMIWGLRINGTLSLASQQKVECHEICGPTKLGVRLLSMIFQTFLFVHGTLEMASMSWNKVI